MNRIAMLAALAAGTGAVGAGAADAQLAVGVGIGTAGAIAEAQYAVAPWLQLRGGYNYFEYDVDDTYDGIAYVGDLDLTTWGAFVDLHPFSNAFVVSGGMFVGDKGLLMAATPTTNTTIGNVTYTPAQIGTLGLDAALEETAPYAGLGWDTTNQGDSRIGVKLLIGVMFSGSPQVNLTASGGTLSNDAAFQNQLAIEETNLQDDVDDYEYYPVVQAGLTYRF